MRPPNSAARSPTARRPRPPRPHPHMPASPGVLEGRRSGRGRGRQGARRRNRTGTGDPPRLDRAGPRRSRAPSACGPRCTPPASTRAWGPVHRRVPARRGRRALPLAGPDLGAVAGHIRTGPHPDPAKMTLLACQHHKTGGLRPAGLSGTAGRPDPDHCRLARPRPRLGVRSSVPSKAGYRTSACPTLRPQLRRLPGLLFTVTFVCIAVAPRPPPGPRWRERGDAAAPCAGRRHHHALGHAGSIRHPCGGTTASRWMPRERKVVVSRQVISGSGEATTLLTPTVTRSGSRRPSTSTPARPASVRHRQGRDAHPAPARVRSPGSGDRGSRHTPRSLTTGSKWKDFSFISTDGELPSADEEAIFKHYGLTYQPGTSGSPNRPAANQHH